MKLQAKQVKIVKVNGDVIRPFSHILQYVGSGEVFKKRKGHDRYKYGRMIEHISKKNIVALIG